MGKAISKSSRTFLNQQTARDNCDKEKDNLATVRHGGHRLHYSIYILRHVLKNINITVFIHA